jgi:hypothetical protein
MRQAIAVFLLLSVGSVLAKDKHEYELTITVLSSQGAEAEYRRSWIKGGGRSVTTNVLVTASDGNTYELLAHHISHSSKNVLRSDVLLPGTYPAALENNGLRVCKSKTDGKCQDVVFDIVKVERTKN